jgi:hypothetical protein
LRDNSDEGEIRMDLTFNLDMQRGGVRNVALFLGGLSLIRDGLEVMTNGVPGGLFDNNSGDLSGQEQHAIWKHVESAGMRLALEDTWEPRIPEAMMSLIFDWLLRSRPTGKDITLKILQRGTLDGVISDIFQKIADRFRRIFDAANSILPDKDGDAMKEVLKEILTEILKESEVDGQTAYLGIGIIIVAVVKLAEALAKEGVTYINARIT